MESIDHLADGLLQRSISNCRQCQIIDGRKWRPCPYHNGYATALADFINQVDFELQEVGYFNG